MPKRAPHILMAYEFGHGFGHWARLNGMAKRLLAARPDARITILLPPSLRGAKSSDPRITLMEPPELGHGTRTAKLRSWPTFGEMLDQVWFEEGDRLTPRLTFWDKCLADMKPGLVVADYAPALTMQARGRVPTLAVGNGYTLPPPERAQFPELWTADATTPRTAEEQSLARVNAACRRNGARTLEHLPQINAADDYGLMTLPIFDPYWEVRTQDYLGVEHPQGSPRPGEGATGVISYFSYPRKADVIVAALGATGLPVRAYVASSESLAPPANVALQAKPFHLAQDLPGAAVVVHAGSLGMAAAAMFAGVPQVCLCGQDENWTIARAVAFASIGSFLWQNTMTVEEVTKAVTAAAANIAMRNYARQLSTRYAAFRDGDPAQAAATRALALLG